jgi:hypothetical protein
MSDLSVSRWRKYGKDRLYVNTADGARVATVCLITGAVTVELWEHSAAAQALVAAWYAEQGFSATPAPAESPPPIVQAAPPVAASPAPVELVAPVAPPASEPTALVPTVDLAANRPGAAAREQAVALREAAPVRTFVARLMGVHTEEAAWRKGYKGEEKVAAELAKLGPRWKVLHAIPVGDKGSDIDHLAVGPAGVFTINAKHHPGGKVWVGGNTIMINGTRVPYIRNSRHEAARAGRLLSAASGLPVEAVGIVVPVGAEEFTVREAPADVIVINRRRLAPLLAKRAEILSDQAIELIFEVARRLETWQTPRPEKAGGAQR